MVYMSLKFGKIMKKHWSILVLTSAISLCSHAATPSSTQDFIAGSEQIKTTYQQHFAFSASI